MLPLSGSCTVDLRSARRSSSRPAVGVRRPHRFRLCPASDAACVLRGRGPDRAALGPRHAGACEPRYVPAAEVPVELRGAGQASRQVNNFAPPTPSSADKLVAVEVLTPGGNWSSYPPHKHDEDAARARPRWRRSTTSRSPRPGGWRYQRVYGLRARPDRHPRRGPHRAMSCWCPTATTARRWPRPATTSTTSTSWPGRPASAPGASATTPRHAWIRDTWDGQEIDPRLPLASGGPHEAHGGAGLVRFLAAQYTERDGVRAAALRRLLRHLRPRQRRRHRPGAAAEHARDGLPYYLARNEQAMVHTAAGYARSRNRLSTLRLHHLDRPRRDQHGHRRGAARRSTGCPVLLLPGDIFATRVASPVLQELEDTRSLRHLGQRLLQAGVALLGPDQPARAAPRRRCSRRCACSPTRPRPARSRSRCRRTCRPRRATGRRSCSPGASGTSAPAAPRAGRAGRAPPS